MDRPPTSLRAQVEQTFQYGNGPVKKRAVARRSNVLPLSALHVIHTSPTVGRSSRRAEPAFDDTNRLFHSVLRDLSIPWYIILSQKGIYGFGQLLPLEWTLKPRFSQFQGRDTATGWLYPQNSINCVVRLCTRWQMRCLKMWHSQAPDQPAL